MKKQLKMPAQYVEILNVENESICGGASSYFIRSIVNAIAGLFRAFDFSGGQNNYYEDSSGIGAFGGKPGASSSHIQGGGSNISWSFDGNIFFSSLANLINLFI